MKSFNLPLLIFICSICSFSANSQKKDAGIFTKVAAYIKDPVNLNNASPTGIPVLSEDRRNVGEFKRVTVHDYLTNGVGVLYSKLNNELFRCTGTLIADKYIITAAHCIYNTDGEIAEEISFIPGLLKNTRTTNNRYFVKQAWINKDFIQFTKESALDETFKYDIAILEVRTNELKNNSSFPGVKYKSKEIATVSPDPMLVHDGLILGYPSLDDNDDKILFKSPIFQYGHRTQNSFVTDQFTSQSGASGGALIGKDNLVYGIVSMSGDEGGTFFAKITEDHKSQIKKIIRGQGREAKNFTNKKIDNRPYFSVNFKSTCNRTIYIAALFKSMETNEFTTLGFFTLNPGEFLSDAFRTQNKNIGFYAQDKNADLVWSGKDYPYELNGETYNFYSKTLPDNWKDKTFIWTCD